MDQDIYVSMLVFALLGTLGRSTPSGPVPRPKRYRHTAIGAALGWVAVTVVADGLEGCAVLDTLSGHAICRRCADWRNVADLQQRVDCVCDHRVVFLASAAWATFDSGVLPRWTGWIAVAGTFLCAASVPAMYGRSGRLHRLL